MRFLVTGAAGFVGSHLSRRLVRDGHAVVGIGRNGVTPLTDDLVQSGRFAVHAVDIADLDGLARVAASAGAIDGVFHVAAQAPGPHGTLPSFVRTNVLGTANVVQVARDVGVRRIVLSSSMSVYSENASLPIAEDASTDSDSAYGVTKLQAEAVGRLAAARWGLHVVCLRYSGIFGRGHPYGSLHLYASRALEGKRIEVFAQGKIVKEFVAVADVVDVNLVAMHDAARFGFEVFNIGGGEARSLGDLAELVVHTVGTGHVALTDTPATAGVRDFSYDISKARTLLGYAPAPLAARVQQYVGELRGATGAA